MLLSYFLLHVARRPNPGSILLLAFGIIVALSIAGRYGYIQKDYLGAYVFCVVVGALGLIKYYAMRMSNPEI